MAEPTITFTIACKDSVDFAGHLPDNIAAILGGIASIDWSTAAPNLTGMDVGFTVDWPAESVPL